MINNLRCRRGFSVTELLVGFGLLSVLVVGAAEGMRLYIATNKHVKVQEQVLDVRANLRGRLNCDNTLTPVTVAKCDGTQYVDLKDGKNVNIVLANGSAKIGDYKIRSRCQKLGGFYGIVSDYLRVGSTGNAVKDPLKGTVTDWKQMSKVPIACGGTASSCDPNVNFIDFEALPGTGRAPTNNLNISDQFQKKFGVTFALANGRLPSIAKVDAGADSAYRCNAQDCSSDYNGLRPGQPSVGRWLLKGANGATYAQNPSPLIITYDSPTASASGNILDIDGAESWTIEALDASDAVTDTVLLRGARAQGDGIQTPFAFSHKTADIKKIRITGHSGSAFGMGFDNFATRGVCPDDQLRVPVAH